MTKRIAIVYFLISLYYLGNSQTPEHEIRVKAIQTVIQGINAQDYKKMKSPWFSIGKLIIPKRILKKEFGPFLETYGTATIDTITLASEDRYIAKLNMAKYPSSRIFLQFIFTKGKIQGMGFSYPPLIYQKRSSKMPINKDSFSLRIDSLMMYRYKKTFNGSILVLDSGNIIYQKHYGFRDFQTRSTLNDTSMYELASCSKQFTAFAILLLAKNGQLSLSDTLQKFIPDFPYQHITIEHLLTHTSGLPDYEALLSKVWDRTKFATNYDVVELLKHHKPKILFKPNECFTYSNTGYVILSLIIEKVSRMSYAHFLESSIFSQLNMSRTWVYNTRRVKNDIISNYAYGYVYSQDLKKFVLPDSTKEYQMVVYQDAITGDGTVNSCTKDLAIWVNELLHNNLLPKDYLNLAFKDHQLNNGKTTGYGYGFFLSGGNISERLVYHTGGWPGYVSIIMHFPDSNKDIIVLSNNSYDNFTRLADEMASILLE